MTQIDRLSREQREDLFPEFRREEAPSAAPEPEAAAQEEAEGPAPLVLSVMAKLASVLAEETALVRRGDFEGFAALQREKSDLIRQAERLQHNRGAMRAIEEMGPEKLKAKLGGFNSAIEGNMRAIGAVKDAIGQVRSRAIAKLEEEKGDGVYRRDGGRQSLQHLSLTATKVKL